MLSDSLHPLPSLVFLLPFSPPLLPTSPLFHTHVFLFCLETKRVNPGPSVRTWVWNSPLEPGGLTSGYSTIAQILIGLFLVLLLVLLLLSDCWKSSHSLDELTPCHGYSLQMFLPHSAGYIITLLITSLLWIISLVRYNLVYFYFWSLCFEVLYELSLSVQVFQWISRMLSFKEFIL